MRCVKRTRPPVNGWLKAIENHEKITADAAKAKIEPAAAPAKEKG
jgi:hypothetical protein